MHLKANKLEVIVVPAKKLTENNPTGCINPLRFLSACHKCEAYQRARAHRRRLTCRPQVSKQAKRLLRERERLLQTLRENTTAIEAL